MPVKVYAYGLLAPIKGAPLVREQMRAAHRYRKGEHRRHGRPADGKVQW